ncbi:MAG: hypothetical protein JNN01_16045 [Opitutaceae bacterium]|nr:hypothetical protein [Opitutaceae bacterium]
MKHTPRRWLLNRHRPAEPALDSLRQAVLAAARSETEPVSWAALLPALFRPHRRVWTALLAAWLCLAGLHLAVRTSDLAAPRKAHQPRATLAAHAPAHGDAGAHGFLDHQAQLHALLR